MAGPSSGGIPALKRDPSPLPKFVEADWFAEAALKASGSALVVRLDT